MSEAAVIGEARLSFVHDEDVRLFRNQVGRAWVASQWLRLDNGDVLLKKPRFYTTGLFPGSSDLIGWRRLIVTGDMVGSAIAQLLSLEGKADRGRLSKEQHNWINRVLADGGRAGMFHNVAEAREIVYGRR